MKVKIKSVASDKDEQDRAREYWSTETAQRLTYAHYSHYSRALAEIVAKSGAESVFEFGCAAGRNLDAIKNLVPHPLNLKGCDVNETFVSRGVSEFGLDLKVGDEATLSHFKNGSFDIAFTVSVLDHIPEPAFALKELLRIAKKAVVIIEPNAEGDSGKVLNVENEWANKSNDSANPYTYLHNYPTLFRKLRLTVSAEVAMPTHLNRMGPLYNMYVLPAGGANSAKNIPWNTIAQSASGTAILQLLKNQQKVQGSHARSLKTAETVITAKSQLLDTTARELRDVSIKLRACETKLLRSEAETELLKAKFRMQAQNLKVAKQKHKAMRASTKYKIGKTIVGIVKFPIWLVSPKKKKVRSSAQPSAMTLLHRAILPSKSSRRENVDTNAAEYRYFDALIGERVSPAPSPSNRIAYILHNSLPFASGGYATRAQGIAKGLMTNGCDVTCFTRPGFPMDQSPEIVERTLKLSENIDGVEYRRLLRPIRTGMKLTDYVEQSTVALEGAFREQGTGIVMAASAAQHTALPALIAARRAGLPFYYEVRGFWEVTRESRDTAFGETEHYNFMKKIENLVCSRADHVFTITGAMRDEIIERGVAAEHVSLVPNSCDISRFTPRGRDVALARKLGIDDDTVVIGYVGTFVDYEGLEDLVSAVAKLRERTPKFKLLLVGAETVVDNSVGPVTRMINDTIQRENLEDHVILTGRVPHSEVEAYYSLIDIAPFPRKPWKVCEMVTPMKPLEAMAMKKSVIVSSVRALSEMVEHEKTGMIFQKGSIESLAEALANLIAKPDLRHSLGENSRVWVENERTWTKSTQAMSNRFQADVLRWKAQA